MGQYQQWLHYREIDQQLRGTLTSLENELAHVQQQAQALQYTDVHDTSYASNAIIQALLKQHAEMLLAEVAAKLEDTSQYIAPLVPPSPSPEPAVAPPEKTKFPLLSNKPNIITPDEDRDETGSISPALFAWSMLPIFNPQTSETIPTPPQVTKTTAPNLQEHLLPEDMHAFSVQHHLTDPPTRRPNIRPPAPLMQPQPRPTGSETSPVDQQSVRTDRLVERWFERWNRPSKTDNPEGQQK